MTLDPWEKISIQREAKMQMAYLGKIRPIKSLYSRWNQCNMPCFNFYNKDLDLYYSGQKMCWSSLSEKRAFQRKVCL